MNRADVVPVPVPSLYRAGALVATVLAGALLTGCSVPDVTAAVSSARAASGESAGGGGSPSPTRSMTSGSASTRQSWVDPVPTPAPDLLQDARWVTRWGVKALRVTPTSLLRRHQSLAWADAGWAQVIADVPAANTPSMRNQYRCHAQFASTKDAWYLEPSRPDVGYTQTVLGGCNPGTVKDVG